MRPLLFLIGVVGSAAAAQGPVLVAGGGNLPPDALAWFVGHARGDSVLVVDYHAEPSARAVAALRAAGAAVAWLSVPDPLAAADSSVVRRVRRAGALFFPGGDQGAYTRAWRGQALARAVVGAWRGGTAVGGTSAGAMILGETSFDAAYGGVTARDAVARPFSDSLSLSPGAVPLWVGLVVETHVAERGRLGRLAAFLVRHHADTGRWTVGLGVDDGTALAVGPDGAGTVYGSGVVTWLAARPETTARAVGPLAVGPLSLVQVVAGGTLDVATGAADLGPNAAPFTPVLPTFPTEAIRLNASMPGVAVVTGGWGDPETEESRVAGLAWAAVAERAGMAVLVPAGSAVWLGRGVLWVKGGTAPALVLDLRQTARAGMPTVRRNGAFRAVLHVVPPGGVVRLARWGL